MNNSKKDHYDIIGSVEGYEQSVFYFDGNNKTIQGKLLFRQQKKAYDIYTDGAGEVFIRLIDINEVICVDYAQGIKDEENNDAPPANSTLKVIPPSLESYPGAKGVIYLDFDGEYVTGGRWGTINALPSSFTSTQITTIWTAISEDYSPFNVNVTTIRSLYDNAYPKRRIMVIFTPTKDAAPQSGGVAILNSFNDGKGDPCWSFGLSVKAAEEAASHESGHSFGLLHDGTSSQAYYLGHGNSTTGWAPIMGEPYTKPIVQWSKGEYTDANNKGDDLARISGLTNGIGYKVDDHGNDITTASPLISDTNGIVRATSNFGVIEKRTDKDVFKFNAAAGNITFSINTKTNSGSASVPNLNIQARLLDGSGTELQKSDFITLNAGISKSVAAGTYYLEIDGVGAGDPLATGYTDYGSLGQFFISGTFPPGIGTGIGKDGQQHIMNIYPNPSSGVFTMNLQAPSGMLNIAFIKIVNAMGQEVMAFSENISGSFQREINLFGYPSGIYCVIAIANENEVWKEKVMIK